MAKWIKTTFPGVRYREHDTRKHGVKKDQYFTIRYKLDGKGKEEGLGWASEDWTASRAYGHLLELKKNKKIGEGPQSLGEKREIEETRRIEAAAEKEQIEKDTLTFNQIFTKQYYPIAEQNKTKGAAEAENSLFKWIDPVIGKLPLKNISPLHLERIKKNMANEGRAPRTAQYALALIRQVFNYAKDNGLYSGACPVSKVKIPKFDNKRQRFLTHEEAEKLLTALKARSIDVYHMALLSLHCGLRAGEGFSLQWADVNIEAGMITLRDTKNGKTRHCQMTSAVKEMFTKRKPGNKDDLVFPSAKGTLIGKISKTFEIVVDELKFNEGVDDPRHKVVWHSLRHTYASWLVQSGVSLYVVQKMLGHSQISQTERYSHLHQDTITDAVKVFEAALKKEKPKAGKVINF
ncbi:MAG: site-specific integrase [Proteobacteria bacterium]|nr:site-specific integrase [Pseudomonadota bacterium]